MTNCNDSGNGSLRDAASAAGSGDTIDLSQLTCGTITLTTGYVSFFNEVTLHGPGQDLLTIDGNSGQGVLQQFGTTDTLFLDNLTIANGKYVDDNFPRGGCIYAQGGVSMNQVTVENCVAIGTGTEYARGGGVYAQGSVSMIKSTVSGNTAEQTSGTSYSQGGGIWAGGSLTSKYSTITDNASYATSDSWNGVAGGAWVAGNATIIASTVSNNQAETVGGLDLTGYTATTPLSIGNSTISGNTSSGSFFGAGIFAGYPIEIGNSTITGNIEANTTDRKYGAGLSLGGTATVELESTIIAGNFLDNSVSGNLASDIGYSLFGGSSSLSGANNLVGFSLITTPPDTILGDDPQLGPLADNGGPTMTQMPAATSPAIDAGNNVGSWTWDQRSSGFARVVGAHADIGAIEYSDVIFANGFD